MKNLHPHLFLAFILLATTLSNAAPQTRPSPADVRNAWATAPQLSPFQALRWTGDTPQILVNGTWYELLAINDLPVEKIVGFCKDVEDRDWHKRFEEDLVAVLQLMGHDPGLTANLAVSDLQTASVSVLPDIPLTAENRRSIFIARHQPPTPPPLIQAATTIPTTQP